MMLPPQEAIMSYFPFQKLSTRTKVRSNWIGVPIFIIQKAATPKHGIKFRQKSIGAVRYSLATSFNEGDIFVGSSSMDHILVVSLKIVS